MVHAIIASFGYNLIIRKVLQLHKLPYDDILTPGCFPDYNDGEDMGDKNEMIQSILSKKHDLQPEQVLLIDDSFRNIQAAAKLKCQVYHINCQTAITLPDVHHITNIVKAQNIQYVLIDADLTLFAHHVTSRYIYEWLDRGHDLESFDCKKVVLADGTITLLRLLRRL